MELALITEGLRDTLALVECGAVMIDGNRVTIRMSDSQLVKLLASTKPATDAQPEKMTPGWNQADFRRFMSPVPYVGYDTVLGYLAKHRPDLLQFMDETPEATQRDGWWLMHRCRERSLSTYKVKAPSILHEQGVEFVNAYPVSLLAERFNS